MHPETSRDRLRRTTAAPPRTSQDAPERTDNTWMKDSLMYHTTSVDRCVTSPRWVAHARSQQGFSLLELVVAVSIMLILGVVGFVSYDTFTANARDAKRVQDVNDVAMALTMYADKHGHVIGHGQHCGYRGEGTGWLNRGGPSDPTPVPPGSAYGDPNVSIMDCLINDGLISSAIIDPSGRSYFAVENSRPYAYMKYNCTKDDKPTQALIFAALETVDPADRMEPDFGCDVPGRDQEIQQHYDRYKMNYWVKVDVM